MHRFVIPPLREGYSFTPAQTLMEQQRIGMPRQKRFAISIPHQISASILLSHELEQKYFWAFWNNYQRNPESFLWALKSDTFDLEDHECKFMVNNPIGVQEIGANKIIVSFGVWVKPLNRDAIMDQTIVEYYSSGFNPNISNLLEHLVNVVMPENLQ